MLVFNIQPKADEPPDETLKWLMFKVIRSNIQTAITLPRIARFRSNLVQSLTMVKSVYYTCLMSKVKGQGNGVIVQGHSVT